MGRITTLITAVVCAIVVIGCATNIKDPPRVSLVGIKPVDVQLFEQRFALTLRIQNPNDTAIPIRGMDYQVTLNGKKFADGVSNETVTIGAFSEEVVTVNVTSTLVRVFEQLRKLDKGGTGIFSYGISGGLALEGAIGKIPFAYTDELDLSDFKEPLEEWQLHLASLDTVNPFPMTRSRVFGMLFLCIVTAGCEVTTSQPVGLDPVKIGSIDVNGTWYGEGDRPEPVYVRHSKDGELTIAEVKWSEGKFTLEEATVHLMRLDGELYASVPHEPGIYFVIRVVEITPERWAFQLPRGEVFEKALLAGTLSGEIHEGIIRTIHVSYPSLQAFLRSTPRDQLWHDEEVVIY